MKKPKTVKRSTPDEIELRRWCVEQAIRWPVSGGYYQGMASVGGHVPENEADILGRADRILNWIRPQR